jgi:hypothetical protein
MNLLRFLKRNTPPPEQSDASPLDEIFELIKIREEDGMAELMRDKLTKCHSIKVPECTWKRLQALSDRNPAKLRELNDQLLIVIAKFLHDAEFDPARYLVENYDTRNGYAR